MLPDTVIKTMHTLCHSLTSRSSVTVEAVYVYGSTALGDYIEGSSDIDFIAIIDGILSPSIIHSITKAHKEVEELLPNSDIMGAYIHREDLGKPVGEITSLLTYFNKQIHTDGKGADINPVTWWVLKNYGLRVYGLEIPFTYEITAETLVKYVVRNMNTYWVSWIERLENQLLVSGISEQTIRADELDQAVEWCVLGMLRQVYTIKEHGITSKIRAGEYGMTFLPNQWHGLIREAIAVKRCEPTRVYISQFKRMSDLVELLRLILLEANQSYRNAYNS